MDQSPEHLLYTRIAEAAEAALAALMPPARKKGGKPRAFRSRRLQTRLRHQREVLERLHSGDVNPDEALVLLIEEEAPLKEASQEVSGYLSRVSGDLKSLKLRLPEPEEDTDE